MLNVKRIQVLFLANNVSELRANIPQPYTMVIKDVSLITKDLWIILKLRPENKHIHYLALNLQSLQYGKVIARVKESQNTVIQDVLDFKVLPGNIHGV